MEGIYGRFFVIGVVVSLFFIGCNNRKELLTQDVYEGPIMEMWNINTMMSDSGKMAMRLMAPLQQDFENGDRHYPEGLFLEYYGKQKTPICTFRSNSATFTQSTNLWKGEGDVHVKNIDNGDELTTEELFWSPNDESFYTEKFVTILSDGEVHTGEGLKANQDFSSYQILKPSGTINLNEDF
jgi:LPS export ABC transporter protein LptC